MSVYVPTHNEVMGFLRDHRTHRGRLSLPDAPAFPSRHRFPSLDDVARWFSRIGVNGQLSGGMQVLSGVDAGQFGANGPVDFFRDAFTGTDGTNLTAHTPDVGAGWSAVVAERNIVLKSNACTIDLDGFLNPKADYQSSADAPSANYTVQADVTLNSGAEEGSPMALVARQPSGSNTGYYFTITQSSGIKVSLGTSPLGANLYATSALSGLTWSAGQTHTMKIVVSGTTISIYVDTFLQASVTDSAYSAAGRPALWMQQQSFSVFKWLVDNFKASA